MSPATGYRLLAMGMVAGAGLLPLSLTPAQTCWYLVVAGWIVLLIRDRRTPIPSQPLAWTRLPVLTSEQWAAIHGGSDVRCGRLRLETDTDYFVWTCPECDSTHRKGAGSARRDHRDALTESIVDDARLFGFAIGHNQGVIVSKKGKKRLTIGHRIQEADRHGTFVRRCEPAACSVAHEARHGALRPRASQESAR